MFKLILCDFDGTLFIKEDDQISKEFVTKIKNLTDCGTIFAVNSGRPYKDLKHLLKGIENRTVFICNDGAQIMYKNCLIYKNPIEKSAFTTLSRELIKNEYGVFAVLREKIIEVTENVLTQKGAIGEEIYKIVSVKGSSGKEVEDRLTTLAQNLGLRICFNDNRYLEFVNKAADKGTATKYIKNRFGIKEKVVALGDGENDIPMFKEADTVFVMKNTRSVYFDGAKQIENAQKFIIENF